MMDYEKTFGAEALAGGWQPGSKQEGKLISPGQ